MTEYKVALIGFGGVNRSLAQLIAERNDIWQQELGFRLSIVGVTDLFLGSLIDEKGLDAASLINVPAQKGAFNDLPNGVAEADNEGVIKNSGADIIAEATFTNPVDGEPAATFCRLALAAGKHVVTTNKGPIAFWAEELKSLAAANNAVFEYEGSVMSGTPVIRMAEKTLKGSSITGFEGILNGTSNYVIGCMEEGMEFDQAVKQAQELGYAEADPTADIEGYDVRLKVAILANELLNADISVSDVGCEGISSLSADDVMTAVEGGKRWKLIGSAKREGDRLIASVAPVLLESDHPLAGISGATNAVSFNTELLGAVTISGPGAGRIETAYALLSDIIAIHDKVSTK